MNKNLITVLYYLLLPILALASDTSHNSDRILAPSNSTLVSCNFGNETDYFYGIRTSKVYKDMKMGRDAYEITYHGKYKLVKNLKVGRTYGLYCRGTEIPENVQVDTWIQIPIERVGVSISVRPALAWLELLGLRNYIKVIVGDSLQVTTPCIAQGIKQGRIKSAADNKISDAINRNDIHGMFVGDVSEEAGAKESIILSYTSPDLGLIPQAEWIKFLAAFFNLEAKAEDIFAQILETQRCHIQNVRTLEERYYLANLMYSQSMFTPNMTQWTLLRSQNVLSLTADAGAALSFAPYPDNIFTVTGDKSKAKDDEPVLKSLQDRLAQTTVIIDWSNITQFLGDKKLEDLTNPDIDRDPSLFLNWQRIVGMNKADLDLIYLPAYMRSKKIFSTSKLVNSYGSSDWDETMIARPDLAVADLIYAQYPSYNQTYKPKWLINLADGQLPNLYDSDSCNLSLDPFKPSYCTVVPNGYRSLNGGDTYFPTIKSTQPQDSSNLSGGGTAGIVIVILLFLAAAGYYIYRKRKMNKVQKHSLPTREPINDTYGSSDYNRSSNFTDFTPNSHSNDNNSRPLVNNVANNSSVSNSNSLPREVLNNPFDDDLDDELLGPEVENDNRFVYNLDSSFPQFPKH